MVALLPPPAQAIHCISASQQDNFTCSSQNPRTQYLFLHAWLKPVQSRSCTEKSQISSSCLDKKLARIAYCALSSHSEPCLPLPPRFSFPCRSDFCKLTTVWCQALLQGLHTKAATRLCCTCRAAPGSRSRSSCRNLSSSKRYAFSCFSNPKAALLHVMPRTSLEVFVGHESFCSAHRLQLLLPRRSLFHHQERVVPHA